MKRVVAPNKDKSVQLGVKIPKDLKDSLKSLAIKKEKTFSLMVRGILIQYVEKQDTTA